MTMINNAHEMIEGGWEFLNKNSPEKPNEDMTQSYQNMSKYSMDIINTLNSITTTITDVSFRKDIELLSNFIYKFNEVEYKRDERRRTFENVTSTTAHALTAYNRIHNT